MWKASGTMRSIKRDLIKRVVHVDRSEKQEHELWKIVQLMEPSAPDIVPEDDGGGFILDITIDIRAI